MRVVVLGVGGQLGREVARVFQREEVIGFGRLELDICDFVYTRRILTDLRPGVVVNTAAFKGLDRCELEPGRAFWVNAFAVRNLAAVCADLDALLVHVSTDYVFDGVKNVPYTEDDVPNPLSVYGVSRLAGEHFVRALAPRHLVVRTSGLYGEGGSGARTPNFVEKMLRLAEEGQPIPVVADQVLTPSAAQDVAVKIADLIYRECNGLFHVTNAGECSWFEFAKETFRLAGLGAPLVPVGTVDKGTLARRPRYSVLAHTRLAQMGIDDLRPWQEALADYLRAQGRLRPETSGSMERN
jgi:dTDP-4-dehydrorhamnose reductase